MVGGSVVKGENGFLGGTMGSQVFVLALDSDLGSEPLSISTRFGHATKTHGVCRSKFSFLAAHSFQF